MQVDDVREKTNRLSLGGLQQWAAMRHPRPYVVVATARIFSSTNKCRIKFVDPNELGTQSAQAE
jgi:hypothetical protein